MYTLGIFNVFNSGVALIKNGKVIYASLEERFNRIKAVKCFPINAINDCLKFANITKKDIKTIAYGGYTMSCKEALEDYLECSNSYGISKAADRLNNTLEVDYKFVADFHYNIGKHFPDANIKYYDHHYSHACLAYYLSKIKNSYVITADGRGDFQSLAIWVSKDRKLQRVQTFCELRSLGFLYGQITYLLGFTPHKDEGKITGLASYGKYTSIVDDIFKIIFFDKTSGKIEVNKDFYAFNSPMKMEYLKDITQGKLKEDIAFAVQYVLEKIMLDVIKHYVPKGSNLCVSGGIFANVKLTSIIQDSGYVNEFFVCPEPGDAGLSLGSAIACEVENGCFDFECKDFYLGSSYSFDDVDLSKYDVKKLDKKGFLKEVVELLEQDKILGLFAGRMEYGSRALGARSIIAQTKNKNINDILNTRLHRTEFMPLAPFTLKSEAKKMFIGYKENDKNANYMATSYEATELMKEISPAVVHINGSVRPQVIDENNGVLVYYEILKAYFDKTGIPSLINTSFNDHGEPIVCTPQDALKALDKQIIDYVVTDSYQIIKNKQ